MKEKIHPDYHEIEISCACGNAFSSRSTYKGKEMKLDICNKCHPFFSGTQKIVDTSGRVDKFKKRFAN